MKNIWQRWSAVAVCALLGLGGALVVTAPAQARPVEAGSLSISGDPDDYVSGGQSYRYSTGSGDAFEALGSPDARYFDMHGANGDIWYVNVKAPTGQILEPGTYQDTGPWESDGAQLYVYRPGHSCAQATGTFTIQNAVNGPMNYLHQFDVTFEQHCDGATAALRGELHLQNPPPPPLLELGIAIAQDGTVAGDGSATAHGTVTCNKASTLYLVIHFRQTVGALQLDGWATPQTQCTPGAPVAWEATVRDDLDRRFRPGTASVEASADGIDEAYDRIVSVGTAATVRLYR